MNVQFEGNDNELVAADALFITIDKLETYPLFGRLLQVKLYNAPFVIVINSSVSKKLAVIQLAELVAIVEYNEAVATLVKAFRA